MARPVEVQKDVRIPPPERLDSHPAGGDAVYEECVRARLEARLPDHLAPLDHGIEIGGRYIERVDLLSPRLPDRLVHGHLDIPDHLVVGGEVLIGLGLVVLDEVAAAHPEVIADLGVLRGCQSHLGFDYRPQYRPVMNIEVGPHVIKSVARAIVLLQHGWREPYV